ncbi:MAG: outer membrane protein assembly factor BamA [Simkaniaceae bacterium]|nr:outer membrane protein assembly factor BamA [Simkaniaceae bacterium]MCF7852336.1 outer membrane protein assembly factor BamA [Simkaniaceae bacterium]
MQKSSFILSAFLLTSILPLYSADPSTKPMVEVIENKNVAKIDMQIENRPKGSYYDPRILSSTMRTKVGEPFSQRVFDQDLKKLSDEYERVDPTVTVKDGEVYIKVLLWEKPFIRAIKWTGNKKVKTKTLQKELGIKPDTQYNKEKFIKAFNKLKEFYVKKGYFEAHLTYRIVRIPDTNEIQIDIIVREGRSAHILKIEFEGLSEKEQSDILGMISAKKYNLFVSWLTGRGIYHPEAMEQDKLVIVNYLQNEGYADAHVDIMLKSSPQQNIIIVVKANKGPLFHFGDVTFEGNTIKEDQEITDALGIKKEDVYSPDKLREAADAIKDLYGRKGYIDTNVRYELRLSQFSSTYDVRFIIEESKQFRIGVIRVLGNVSTETPVILNHSTLTPGEVFDADKLKQTQHRLEALGFFKSVNVYAVRNPDDTALGPEYRDVNIEVQETSTGSMSLFFGASSTDSVNGGVDLVENNFNHRGLGRFFDKGLKGLRGGGEYARLNVSIGPRYQTYAISWLNPYFADSLWRVGFDVSYSKSRITSKSFKSNATGLNFYASYPLSAYWSYGWKFRISNTVIKVGIDSSEEAQRQSLNSGIVSGVGLYFGYDSTDNILRPHRGFRSTIEGEIAGVRRHDVNDRDFLFAKLFYLNSYYIPVWRKGTLKFRGDLKFLTAMGNGEPILLPANERFFLGGDNSVRGFQPGIIGPKYVRNNGTLTNDPAGGASSALFSTEYLQNIFRPLDAFVFFDAGAVTLNEYAIGKFRASVGGGLRIDIGSRLPLVVGWGYPLISRTHKDEIQNDGFFFSMAGQF